MQRIPLAEYAAKRHAWTASRLKMSQGSLSKAIREGRLIYVIVTSDGRISAVEEKPFPGQRRCQHLVHRDDSAAGAGMSAPKVPVNPDSGLSRAGIASD